jgi:secreted trypsin-like serine protease
MNEENQRPDYLSQVGVNIFRKDWCENSPSTRHKSIGLNNICAGLPDFDNSGFTDPGKDSCLGDSGGPLTQG